MENIFSKQSWAWLQLASLALGLSALLAILLVFSRMPFLQAYLGLDDAFHTILVLHVNFAVLVWLLSFIGFIWVANLPGLSSLINAISLKLAYVGVALMFISPWFEHAEPIMSNYVPVLQSPVYFTGLGFYASAISLLAWQVLRLCSWNRYRFAALIWFVAVIALLGHLWRVDAASPEYYFERTFWGAGHIVQFLYVVVLAVLWQQGQTENNRLEKWVLAAIVIVAVLLTWADPNSNATRHAFTALMQWGMLLLLFPLLMWYAKNQKQVNQDWSLSASIMLMILGMLVGISIASDTVIVTAHYHATNAALTIAFMGYAYWALVKQLGLVGWQKAMRYQVVLYGFGMTLYVLGMAGSGWLGVPRKAAVTIDQGYEKLSMAIMGIGGLLSIIATLLFVTIALKLLNQLVKNQKELS